MRDKLARLQNELAQAQHALADVTNLRQFEAAKRRVTYYRRLIQRLRILHRVED